MFRLTAFLPVLALAMVLGSCANEDPVASSGGAPFYADQGYYPTEVGSEWNYRIDTTSAKGVTVRDVARKHAVITGTRQIDSVTWAVQTTTTRFANDSVSIDTLYIRKGQIGVYLTSPALRNFGQLPLPNLSFPKEFLVLPYQIWPGLSWELLNFEYSFTIITIKFLVKATYLGIEPVQVGTRTFKDCARIRIDIDARLPNLQNPQDILNPTIIKESANFWLSKPFGIVVGDGASSVFSFLGGGIPLGANGQKTHQELLDLNIVQPNTPCLTGK